MKLPTRHIGIIGHSYGGACPCFNTICSEGTKTIGEHMQTLLTLNTVPMGLNMSAWETGDHQTIVSRLFQGLDCLKKSGAVSFLCPDNKAHIVLEKYEKQFGLRGLHIADSVCSEIIANDWKRVGLLGTNWTMTGPVYEHKLISHNLAKITPKTAVRREIHQLILDELCLGTIKESTIIFFQSVIEGLKQAGAECVILGCTEIPLIINDKNSLLPVLDSNRLLVKKALEVSSITGLEIRINCIQSD